MRLGPTSQNRARLSGFSLHEQHILRCREHWLIIADVFALDFILLQTTPFDGRGTSAIGSDDTILVSNGLERLGATVHVTATCVSYDDDHMLFKITSRTPIDEEKLKFLRLPADKALTDPGQMRIFEELTPRK